MSGPELIRAEPVSGDASGPRGKRPFPNPYFTIIVSVVLDAAAQVLLKIGANNAVASTAWLGISGLRSGWVWLGMLAMVLSMGTWLYSLRFVPLNVASNLTGTVHVLVPLSCWYFLGELINPGRWIGILLVIVGVFIIVRPVRQVEEKMEGRL